MDCQCFHKSTHNRNNHSILNVILVLYVHQVLSMHETQTQAKLHKVPAYTNDPQSAEYDVSNQSKPGLRRIPPKSLVTPRYTPQKSGKPITEWQCHYAEDCIHLLPIEASYQRHNQSIMYRTNFEFRSVSRSTHWLDNHIAREKTTSN